MHSTSTFRECVVQALNMAALHTPMYITRLRIMSRLQWLVNICLYEHTYIIYHTYRLM